MRTKIPVAASAFKMTVRKAAETGKYVEQTANLGIGQPGHQRTVELCRCIFVLFKGESFHLF